MKTTRLLTLLCLSSISIAVNSFAVAGTRANTLTLSGGGGGYFFADKRRLDNTGILQGAVGYNFTDHWGIEGMFGFLDTKFKRSALNLNESYRHKRKVYGDLFAVDGIYHFTPFSIVEPYVMFGVGLLSLSPNGNSANDEGNINGGLGLQFFVDKVVSFRVEARDFYTLVGGKNDVYVDGVVSFALDFC